MLNSETTKFAYYHQPSQRWAHIDCSLRRVSLVDSVDFCLYNSKFLIKEDFLQCREYMPYYSNVFPCEPRGLTDAIKKEFVLVPIQISHRWEPPKEIRKIEYNTFGKRDVDNQLVDFLNTLRDELHLIEPIQTKVMAFMHELNRDMFDIRLKTVSIRAVPPANPKFNRRLIALFLKDYKERVKSMKWREPLKCKVNACLMERFRELGI